MVQLIIEDFDVGFGHRATGSGIAVRPLGKSDGTRSSGDQRCMLMESQQHDRIVRPSLVDLAAVVAGFQNQVAVGDLTAAVLACPDGRPGDLVRHVGSVHEWATVFNRSSTGTDRPDE